MIVFKLMIYLLLFAGAVWAGDKLRRFLKRRAKNWMEPRNHGGGSMGGQLSIWGEGWINKRNQAPKEEDADVRGEVLVWHRKHGVMVSAWWIVENSLDFTHWMQTPAGPAEICWKKRMRA